MNFEEKANKEGKTRKQGIAEIQREGKITPDGEGLRDREQVPPSVSILVFDTLPSRHYLWAAAEAVVEADSEPSFPPCPPQTHLRGWGLKRGCSFPLSVCRGF